MPRNGRNKSARRRDWMDKAMTIMEKSTEQGSTNALFDSIKQHINRDATMRFQPKTDEEVTFIKRFALEVSKKSKEVDPDNDRDWLDITFGFMLGCGIPVLRAYELAIWVCYDTNLA